MSNTPTDRLTLPRVVALSSLSIPIAGVGLPVGVYLAPLYANEVGLGLGLTGLLFMLLRFWDIVTDPVMGYLVDRVRTPLGRVRHWILLAAPVLGLATYFVYMPPREGAGPWYFIVWMLLFYVGFTILQTARAAWIPAVAQDYDDRSRLFVWAEIVSVLAMLSLLAVPALLPLAGYEVDRFGQVAVMGWILIIALPVTAILSCLLVPDRPAVGETKTVDKFEITPFFQAVRHPAYVRIISIEFLASLAISITASNYLFVAEFVFGLSDQRTSIALMTFFVMAIVGMPFWLMLARRTEKHIAFMSAVSMSAIGGVLYFLLSQVGGFYSLMFGAMFSGFAFSAPIFLARAMTADVVEAEIARTGQNRAGIFYSLLTTFGKVGSALAFGAGYFLVGQVAGFDPQTENSPEAIQGLLLIFCFLPAGLYVFAALIARSYTLTRAVQSETARSLAGTG